VDKAALRQVFSQYFDFPYQSSFHQFLHHHNHPRRAQSTYWWPQCRVDPIGLHPPLYQLKKLKNSLLPKRLTPRFSLLLLVEPGLPDKKESAEVGAVETSYKPSGKIRSPRTVPERTCFSYRHRSKWKSYFFIIKLNCSMKYSRSRSLHLN
jgi:hypothetical protein